MFFFLKRNLIKLWHKISSNFFFAFPLKINQGVKFSKIGVKHDSSPLEGGLLVELMSWV